MGACALREGRVMKEKSSHAFGSSLTDPRGSYGIWKARQSRNLEGRKQKKAALLSPEAAHRLWPWLESGIGELEKNPTEALRHREVGPGCWRSTAYKSLQLSQASLCSLGLGD